MIKITNPFNDGVNPCFGCADNHPFGLHLEFYEDDEGLQCTWDPGEHFQGFPGILHGGIQTTLMDEIASWTVFIKGKTAGVTSGMRIRFKRPVMVGRGNIILRSNVKSTGSKQMVLFTQLFDSGENLCTEGDITYFIYPEHIAREKFRYPGIEAFYR